MKAISPIVATVLLIGIVVVIAGIVNLWTSNFFASTKDIKKEADTQVGCLNAKILSENIRYCNTRLSGIIYNSGMENLGNITIFIIYQNGTQQISDLNTSLLAGNVISFNVTVGSNYDLVRIATNCTEQNVNFKRNKIILC
jgi:flagellin-like protein